MTNTKSDTPMSDQNSFCWHGNDAETCLKCRLDKAEKEAQTFKTLLLELFKNGAGFYFSAIELDTYGKDRLDGEEWGRTSKNCAWIAGKLEGFALRMMISSSGGVA